MKSERGPLPRRRRDLRARLDEIRGGGGGGTAGDSASEEPAEAKPEPAIPVPGKQSPRAPMGPASERRTLPSRPPAVTNAEPVPREGAAAEPASALDPRRFSRIRSARRAAERTSAEGEANDTMRAPRASAFTTRKGPPPPRSPDPALVAVDEWIDPATADRDHFSPRFPLPLPFGADVLYFDLETTGLGAHELIAISGTLRPENGGLRLRQHVAFDAAQERRALERTLEDLHGVSLVVTYNGRTFDLPFLTKRLRWHRLPELDPALEHLDLLIEIRRRYRKEWKDCSLGSAEQILLEKTRTGPDVPGREVPLRFADVRDGAPLSLLEPVIHHNRIDLTSLVALHAGRIAEEGRAGEPEPSPRDPRP